MKSFNEFINEGKFHMENPKTYLDVKAISDSTNIVDHIKSLDGYMELWVIPCEEVEIDNLKDDLSDYDVEDRKEDLWRILKVNKR